MNFCWWLIISRNLRSSETFLGRSIFSIAAVLSVLGTDTMGTKVMDSKLQLVFGKFTRPDLR